MRHENNIRPQKFRRTHVFYDIVVVTHEYAALPAFYIEHNIPVARSQCRMYERMQFAVFRFQSVAVNAHMGFVKASCFILFEKTGKKGNARLTRYTYQLLRTGAFGYKFGYIGEFPAGKVLGESISAYRTFMERHYIRSLVRRTAAHTAYDRKVVFFVVVARLELYGRYLKVLHICILQIYIKNRTDGTTATDTSARTRYYCLLNHTSGLRKHHFFFP